MLLFLLPLLVPPITYGPGQRSGVPAVLSPRPSDAPPSPAARGVVSSAFRPASVCGAPCAPPACGGATGTGEGGGGGGGSFFGCGDSGMMIGWAVEGATSSPVPSSTATGSMATSFTVDLLRIADDAHGVLLPTP
jgi:hypothetical protein